MTIDEKSRVLKLKENGLGYKAISKKLNLPINTVKSILRRENNAKVCKCKHCGKELKLTAGKKEKKYCDNKCRMRYWYENRYLLNTTIKYEVECECCKKKFTFYGYSGRKYCSRKCYLRSRYGER